jgi:hypothetical protein
MPLHSAAKGLPQETRARASNPRLPSGEGRQLKVLAQLRRAQQQRGVGGVAERLQVGERGGRDGQRARHRSQQGHGKANVGVTYLHFFVAAYGGEAFFFPSLI